MQTFDLKTNPQEYSEIRDYLIMTHYEGSPQTHRMETFEEKLSAEDEKSFEETILKKSCKSILNI